MIPLVILVSIYLIAKIVNKWFFDLESNSKRYKKIEITKQRMLRNIITAAIYFSGFIILFYSIPQLRSLSSSLFAGVGILGLIIGLAAQDSLSNLVAGVTIALFQPFRLGDRLRILDEDGVVEDITLRHTVIKTWENKRIIIPNHIISKEAIVNYTISDKKEIKFIDISISYDGILFLCHDNTAERTTNVAEIFPDRITEDPRINHR